MATNSADIMPLADCPQAATGKPCCQRVLAYRLPLAWLSELGNDLANNYSPKLSGYSASS